MLANETSCSPLSQMSKLQFVSFQGVNASWRVLTSHFHNRWLILTDVKHINSVNVMNSEYWLFIWEFVVVWRMKTSIDKYSIKIFCFLLCFVRLQKCFGETRRIGILTSAYIVVHPFYIPLSSSFYPTQFFILVRRMRDLPLECTILFGWLIIVYFNLIFLQPVTRL